jgi:hypothetical protein
MSTVTKWVSLSAALIGLALVAPSASAEAEGVESASCALSDVQYDVSATLLITGTTMGAGNGEHRVGPGKVVLRFDNRNGQRAVRLLTYDLQERFTVVAKSLLWTTQVTTSIEMRAGNSGTVADGTLTGHVVQWSSQAKGVHSDGTLSCEGSMCGKFGAPPSGTSELHAGPNALELKPFEFSADMKTFAMPYTLVSKSASPQQQTLVALSGRERNRACVLPASAD